MLSTNELIGKNLLTILNHRGIKQSDLAEQLNWNKQVVNKIVHGRKSITVEEINEICKALNINIDILMKNKNEENINPIKLFMGKVKTKEAKIGLKHAEGD
jgi:transcriptional regulator with XRE-family HTH domain